MCLCSCWFSFHSDSLMEFWSKQRFTTAASQFTWHQLALQSSLLQLVAVVVVVMMIMVCVCVYFQSTNWICMYVLLTKAAVHSLALFSLAISFNCAHRPECGCDTHCNCCFSMLSLFFSLSVLLSFQFCLLGWDLLCSLNSQIYSVCLLHMYISCHFFSFGGYFCTQNRVPTHRNFVIWFHTVWI